MIVWLWDKAECVLRRWKIRKGICSVFKSGIVWAKLCGQNGRFKHIWGAAAQLTEYHPACMRTSLTDTGVTAVWIYLGETARQEKARQERAEQERARHGKPHDTACPSGLV